MRTEDGAFLSQQSGTSQAPGELQREAAMAQARGAKLQHALLRSRLREALLISIAVLEAGYLLASFFGLI
jgi:hypothetical protein